MVSNEEPAEALIPLRINQAIMAVDRSVANAKR